MSFEEIESFVNNKMTSFKLSELNSTRNAILGIVEKVKPSKRTVEKFKRLKSNLNILKENTNKILPYFNYIVMRKRLEDISTLPVFQNNDVLTFASLEYDSEFFLAELKTKLRGLKLEIRDIITHVSQKQKYNNS